ncbi:mcl1 [Candida jiufengensis]|uniref:mcl1 n=1 Tax=Candida jiufengensis TaxID=497108 RepID=UPI00222543B0|nr:mcl1 [Candida jiufengensis]KAI5951319.1 mcl1 [Candida jiufengensis]
MSSKIIPLFSDGNSYIYFHNQLDRLIIVNSEGITKLVNLNDLDSQPISIDTKSNVTSLAINGNKLAITTLDGYAELIDLDKKESVGELYRTALPLRDLKFINQGNRILCGGDDNQLTIVDLANNNNVTNLEIPDQLLNISYDQAGELSAISLSNGSVEIYSVFNEKLNLLHTLNNVLNPKIFASMDKIDYEENEEELFTSKTQWTNDGKYLILPSVNNEIQVYERENWEKIKTFKVDSKIVDFNLNYKKLAVLTKNVYKAFNFDTGKILHEDDFDLKEEALPLNIEWENKSSILIGTTYGDVLRLRNVIKDDTERSSAVNNLFLDDAEESDLEENDNEKHDDVNDREEVDQLHKKRLFIDDEDDFDNSILDEDDDTPNGYSNGHSNGHFNGHTNGYSIGHKRQKSTTPQPSFTTTSAPTKIIPYSPGSTPFVTLGESSDRRYLTMNNIGYAWIVINKDKTTNNSITVSFFDRSINNEYHFTDLQNFDLASMNHKCIILSESSKGIIFYKSHNNINDNGLESWEKKIPLLEKEYITSIAITNSKSNNNTIIVGTNFGYLRFFNQFGLCLNIIKTNPVVTIAASSNNTIFVINQLTNNVYSYSIIDIMQDYKYIQQNSVIPLKEITKGSTLNLIKGIFFNEFNDPCVVSGSDDTLLILQSWRETGNAKWIPILNCFKKITEYGTNENKKNWSCWPLGLINDNLNCLILKNNNKFPGFPLPLPIEIEIEIPIKIGNEENDEQEEEELFVRSLTMGKILNDTLINFEEEEPQDQESDEIMSKLQNYSMIFDKSLLKLFGESCKHSNLNKAFSIVKLIKTDKALSAALKISERMEFLNLASKIGQLREQLLIDLNDNDSD